MHHQELTFSNKNYSKYCLLRFKMFHSTFQTVKILLQTTFKRTNVCATSIFPRGRTISILLVHEKLYPRPIGCVNNQRNTLRE